MSELPKDDAGLVSIVNVVDVFLGSVMFMLAALSVIALALVVREMFSEMLHGHTHKWFHKFLEKTHLVHAR